MPELELSLVTYKHESKKMHHLVVHINVPLRGGVKADIRTSNIPKNTKKHHDEYS